MNAGAKRRGDDAGKDNNAGSAPKRRTQASAAAPRQSGAAAPLTALGVASAPPNAMNAGAKRRSDDAGKENNARSAPKRPTLPKKAKRGRSTSKEPPGNGDGGDEGAKKARLPFGASVKKAASDVPGGERPAKMVTKTYYSCGGPRASWEAAATVSAAARELVELPGTIIT